MKTLSEQYFNEVEATRPDFGILSDVSDEQLESAEAVSTRISRDVVGAGKSAEKRDRVLESIRSLGEGTGRKLSESTDGALRETSVMTAKGTAAESITLTLLSLREQVSAIDPSKLNNPSPLLRVLSLFPRVNTLERYRHRAQSVREQVDAIKVSLLRGKEQVNRQIASMGTQRDALLDALEHYRVDILTAERTLEALKTADVDESDSLLVALKQRLVDLYAQYKTSVFAFAQLGKTRNDHRRLVDLIDRAQRNTMVAVELAASVAIYTKTQEDALTALSSLDKAAGDILLEAAQTSQRVSRQLVMKESTSGIDQEKLDQAYHVMIDSLDEVAAQRREITSNLDDKVENIHDLYLEVLKYDMLEE